MTDQIELARAAIARGLRPCSHVVVDDDGEQQPCGRASVGWHWYQDVEHEDCLDAACDIHQNDGGNLIAELIRRMDPPC